MKQLSTIFLVLVVFLQTFSRFVVEANYFINKDYLAREVCINKAKPKMKCHGKCFLAKQLKEHDNEDRETPVNKKLKVETPLCIILEKLQLLRYEQDSESSFTFGPAHALPTFPRFVYHPPNA